MKLKNKQLIGILYLFIILTSCKSEMKNELTEKPFPVVIEEFSQSKFHHSDTTTLTIRKNDSINFHLFGLESDGEYEIIIDFPFVFNQKDSSQILIDNIPVKLVSEKKYSDKNKQLTVKKYYYDIENQADEEGNFFVMQDRVIAFSSDAWNLQKFYKYDNSKIYELLKKDTTDFFYRFKSDRIIE